MTAPTNPHKLLRTLVVAGLVACGIVAAAFADDSNWTTWAGADPATRQMLLGRVANIDGVRDDVDDAIKEAFPNDPLISTALFRYARSLQQMLGANNLNDVRWADMESYLSMECLRSRIGDVRALQLHRWIDTIVLDTQIRQITVDDNRGRIANKGRIPAEVWEACATS